MRILGVIRAASVCGAAVAASGCATTAVLQQELTKTNTQTVLAFEETVFNKHDVTGAFFHYVDLSFLQHTPSPTQDRDLAERAYAELVTQRYASSHLDVERAVAQGNLVVTQASWQPRPGAASIAVIDIFRVRDGRIIEHWDVIQSEDLQLPGIEGIL